MDRMGSLPFTAQVVLRDGKEDALNGLTVILSMWEYDVHPHALSHFKKAYGPNGDWARLFQQCPGYIKTELLQDTSNQNRFITLDYWQSHAAFLAMKQLIAADYQALDVRCEEYTISETHLGVFKRAS